MCVITSLNNLLWYWLWFYAIDIRLNFKLLVLLHGLLLCRCNITLFYMLHLFLCLVIIVCIRFMFILNRNILFFWLWFLYFWFWIGWYRTYSLWNLLYIRWLYFLLIFTVISLEKMIIVEIALWIWYVLFYWLGFCLINSTFWI